MDDGADAHRRPPQPRSSRRRSRRRRPPAGSVEDGPVCRDPITQEEPRFSGLSPRRSGTRSQSQASSFPPPVFYPDGSVGIPSPPGEVMGYATTHGRRRPGTRSQASSSSSAPRSNQRGAEGRTRVRPSVLYSDRIRYSQPRRLAPAQEHVTSSIEVSSPVMNVPTVEALSLSDQPLSVPEKPEEIFDKMPGDFGQSAPYTYHPKGISRSMVLSLGSLVKIVSTEKKQKPETEIDIEEKLRLFEEYCAAHPKSFWQAVDEAKARERATLAALAAELRMEGQREVPQQASVGTYPPREVPQQASVGTYPPREVPQQASVATYPPREVPQQASVATSYPQHRMLQRAPSCEASKGETSQQTGNEWMKKEVMLCFDKYIERSSDLAGLVDYDLDELLHQCFNMESYDKVFHHYNFTVRMKMPNSVDWTVQLYFAEAKEIFMRKYYVCYPLEPNENGCCYACKSQGVNDLRHPAIDVFEMGSCDSPCGLWYTDE